MGDCLWPWELGCLFYQSDYSLSRTNTRVFALLLAKSCDEHYNQMQKDWNTFACDYVKKPSLSKGITRLQKTTRRVFAYTAAGSIEVIERLRYFTQPGQMVL